MAIARVGAAQPGSNSGSSSLTFSVTVGAGADFLTLKLGLHGFTGTITSVTFDGNPLTVRRYQTTSQQDRRTALLFLASPPISTADVVIQLSAAPANAIHAIAQAYSGVDASATASAAQEGTSLPSSLSHQLDVITTADGSWVDDVIALNGGGSPAVAAGDNTGNEQGEITLSGRTSSSFASMGAAPDTADMDWTTDASVVGSMAAMELVAAGAPASNFLLLLNARGDN